MFVTISVYRYYIGIKSFCSCSPLGGEVLGDPPEGGFRLNFTTDFTQENFLPDFTQEKFGHFELDPPQGGEGSEYLARPQGGV